MLLNLAKSTLLKCLNILPMDNHKKILELFETQDPANCLLATQLWFSQKMGSVDELVELIFSTAEACGCTGWDSFEVRIGKYYACGWVGEMEHEKHFNNQEKGYEIVYDMAYGISGGICFLDVVSARPDGAYLMERRLVKRMINNIVNQK